jgi:hypothetical protein
MASLLKVEEVFAGTNYLEDVSKVQIADLRDKRYPGALIRNSPDSIFNKFSIFTYSNFINGIQYDPGHHFIGYQGRDRTLNGDLDGQNKEEVERLLNENAKNKAATIKTISEGGRANETLLQAVNDNLAKIAGIKASAQAYAARNKSTIANPTASNIITWASEKSTHSVTGFQPYSWTDFIFCKYYGKIPNNRLITLRRYPFPVDDQLVPIGMKQPLPIAQAVTWWGGETGNSLSSIGVMKWNLKWGQNIVTPQDITGNEVLVKDVLGILDGAGLGEMSKALQTVYVAYTGSNANLQQITGQEQKMQDYIRGLYESNGPYWNRIFGPVNVIDRSVRRERGIQDDWQSQFTINFHYSFRSFNGLSPKVVALDLIASFLNLTYADAQFLGQLQRYFANPGVKFEPAIGEMLGNVLTQYATSFEAGNTGALMKMAEKTVNSIRAIVNDALKSGSAALRGDFSGVSDGGKRLVQVGLMQMLSDAVPKFISAKSALSDRPVGEWHLVVGNPMNPIMTMGDLICTKCDMIFDEEMGPDDFPTGVTFKVMLQQGKPRDKLAIERMFNLGQSKMMRSKLRNPSSTEDTQGTVNNKAYEQLKNSLTGDELDKIRESFNYPDGKSSLDPADEVRAKQNAFIGYRNRIRRAYRYGPESNNMDSKSTPYDDQLLLLYYDRRQHGN